MLFLSLLIPSAVLFAFGAHRLFLSALALRARRAAPARPAPAASCASAPAPDCVPAAGNADPAELPFVTLQLPVFNERLVVRRLVESAGAMRWPRERFEIQVLDDSSDDTSSIVAVAVAELRARGVSVTHLRRAHREGYKAGALARGLRAARGDLIAIFDADFLPPRDFLERTVPWFRDPGVGLVQARWSFLNEHASLLTQAQAMMLRGHFRIEHLARSRTGRAFNFNGTAGIWRRAAIEDAGGWHGDTLTEDLDLSYRAFLRGWRFHYLDDLACPSELPPTVKAFRAQQFRWTKGMAQVARKLLPTLLRARVRPAVKVEALFHLLAPCAYPFVLLSFLVWLPCLLFRPAMTGSLEWTLGFGGLLFATLAGGVFYFVAERAGGPVGAVSFLRRYVQLLVVGMGNAVNATRALLEGFAGLASPFRRTPKYAAMGARPPGAAGPRGYRLRLDALILVEAGMLVYGALLSAATLRLEPLAAPWSLLFLGSWVLMVGAQVRETVSGRG